MDSASHLRPAPCYNSIMQFLFPIAFAFVLSFVVTAAAVKIFPRLKMLDRPWKYGLKRPRIPYYGGISLYITFIAAVLIFLPMNLHVAGVLVGATMIFAISLLDDIFEINPIARLIVQVLAAAVLVLSGIGILSITNPLGGAPLILDSAKLSFSVFGVNFSFALLSALFTVIWIVLIVNTMNFLDGVPGMVSGITFIAGAALFLLSIKPGHLVQQDALIIMSGILAAMALGFLFFDFHPARILMGDSGSMLLGFILAVLAIFSGGKIATAFLVLGFPILDAIWSILRRIMRGQSPFKGDFKHLHHRLIEAGLSERRSLILIYFISAVFGGVAVFIGTEQKLIAIIILLTLLLLISGLIFLKKRNV